MVSNLKSDTARANGAKSRGPTTPEGKEKSSRNSLKHGLTAGNGNILLDCEDPAEFDEVLNKLLGIHAPATPAEKDIVDEMFAARWRIRRMWTVETNLLNLEIVTQQSKTDNPEPGIHLAMAFRSLTDDSRSLTLASRYEARLQRVFDRSYKTLRELQQTRKDEGPKQPPNINIRWYNPETEPNPTGSHNPSASEEQSYSPSVSEGAGPGDQPTPEPKLRNEPTAAANNDVHAGPIDKNAAPPSAQPAKSDIQHPSSTGSREFYADLRQTRRH
jgi:hypothetical protein